MSDIIESKAERLARKYFPDGVGVPAAESACIEMAEWCDMRHGWRVDEVTALRMAREYVDSLPEDRRSVLRMLRDAYMAGGEAVHRELTGEGFGSFR